MERVARIGRDLAIMLLAIAGIVLACTVGPILKHFDTDEGEISKGISDTFDTLNRPCKGSGDDKADHCGTLALAGQTIVNAGDLVKHSQLVEAREQTLFDQQLPAMLDQARGTLASAQSSISALQPLMAESQARIHDLQGAEIASAKLIEDLDAQSLHTFAQVDTATARLNVLLADPAVPDLIHHSAGITASADSMLFTANQVELKATKTYLHPSTNPVKRTWQTVQPFLLPGAQIGAAVIR